VRIIICGWRMWRALSARIWATDSLTWIKAAAIVQPDSISELWSWDAGLIGDGARGTQATAWAVCNPYFWVDVWVLITSELMWMAV
jgi:hypothetical protein